MERSRTSLIVSAIYATLVDQGGRRDWGRNSKSKLCMDQIHGVCTLPDVQSAISVDEAQFCTACIRARKLLVHV